MVPSLYESPRIITTWSIVEIKSISSDENLFARESVEGVFARAHIFEALLLANYCQSRIWFQKYIVWSCYYSQRFILWIDTFHALTEQKLFKAPFIYGMYCDKIFIRKIHWADFRAIKDNRLLPLPPYSSIFFFYAISLTSPHQFQPNILLSFFLVG